MPVLEPPKSIRADSPGPGVGKAVTIAEPERLSPPLRPTLTSQGSGNDPNAQSHRQHRVSGTKRLTGRPAYKGSTSSLNSVNSVAPSDVSDNPAPGEAPKEQGGHHHHGHRHHHRHHDPSRLLSQVMDWLHEEKRKRSRRPGSKAPAATEDGSSSAEGPIPQQISHAILEQDLRRDSESSDGSLSLEKLEQILAEHNLIHSDRPQASRRDSRGPHLSKRPSIRKLTRKSTTGFSSDTEYVDGDAIVPSVDVVLDNSKTVGFTGAAAESTTDLTSSSKRAAKERDGWLTFKSEIVRLAHTLRLKGWRRVPLDRGGDIYVERLSGALTNAVYVVCPPKDLPPFRSEGASSSISGASKRPPPKLLLRVYGPQVEHLINRESELQILRRLARKRIGPRLLGTFINGRFEEYFNARTLTAHDLRIPETSKQIAKRMRELHDGIDLLESERDAGPFVWRNWDKWVKRCEEVINWVDRQVVSGDAGPPRSRTERWRKRGLVCGVEWAVFRSTVEKYRKWLEKQYGGPAHLKEQLVFAHNDTQYGNLLRIEPSGESPLLLPANEHKQLVVIDFEYASANVRGLEFANHFTEWCYNYHDSPTAHHCNPAAYPTPSEQHRFLRAYVQHRPQFSASASGTPKTAATPGPSSSSSISAFMLDSRMPQGGGGYAEEERKREENVEKEVQRLMRETRLWRVANSAQWVAWGVVQAKVGGMDEMSTGEGTAREGGGRDDDEGSGEHGRDEDHDVTPTPSPAPAPESASASVFDPLASQHRDGGHEDKRPEGAVMGTGESPHEDDGDEGFDYLGYAQERALFFWGDCLALGIVGEGDLPAETVRKVKRVEY